MTKISLMRHAVKLWQVPHVPREISRSNARKWVAAVERLGDKRLLAQPIRRQGMKETGGPAFPTKNYAAIQPLAEGYSEGMTMRDWFAGKAMTTLFYPAIMESIRTDKDLDCDQVAAFAYLMADALLKERSKE